MFYRSLSAPLPWLVVRVEVPSTCNCRSPIRRSGSAIWGLIPLFTPATAAESVLPLSDFTQTEHTFEANI